MKTIFCLFSVIIPVVLFSINAFPAKLPTAKCTQNYNHPWITAQQYQVSKKKAIKKIKRKVARSGESAMAYVDTTYRNFVNDILDVQTPEQLDQKLRHYDREDVYSKLRPSEQYVIAQIMPLIAFRGFNHRIFSLLDKNGISHSMLVTYAKQIAAVQSIYFPSKNWKVGFRYTSEPYDNMFKRFNNTREFQVFLMNEVHPIMDKSVRRLKAIDMRAPFAWDARLYFGQDSFRNRTKDAKDRYRLITNVERDVVLSSFYSSMWSLAILNAYSIEGLLTVTDKIGELTGFDKAFWSEAEGASSYERNKIITEVRKSKTYLMRLPGYQACMNIAFKHLQSAVAHTSLAWKSSDRFHEDNDWQFLNFAFFKGFDRITQPALNLMEELVNIDANQKETTVSIASSVTGDVVNVDFVKFYTAPPKDLAVFMPKNFRDLNQPEMKSKKIRINGKNMEVKYRNYFRGQATAWNVDAYKKYFPGTDSNAKIKIASRALAQTWGGWMIGGPLSLGIW